MRERDIFIEALEMGDPSARAAHLDDACRDDAALRRRVEDLLAEHDRQQSFILDSPPPGSEATLNHEPPIAEGPGTVIGPYKLLQQIGEGGMGVVFMAEQTEPIQRTVALKIIKPGMDTRQVIARFEAERQAVAMMDHPNIAKVLDAGTTDSGRPFFVMELVKGVPITKYCDEKLLPLPARLELFMQVCQAVQHAHQKGIIHRDIKPNNVLVAEYDNRAVPKVIDFGVAKATAQRLTERTMFTEFGQVLGTMEYMSPEQSKFNQLDIDTRSDIYSLGVLLYELLAGSTPFEGTRLHAAAFDEMLRIIREEEPPKPSTRLSSIDTLPSVAANRNTEPARLSKDVRGELDWIVMKALEKDRNRRYETASGFAADIERHLRDEPVEACPPSATYRFRKFARRHIPSIAAAGALAFMLIVATTFSTWQAKRATHALEAETRARREAHIAEQRASSAAQRALTEASIAQAVSDFLNQDLLGQTYQQRAYDRFNESTAELKLLTVLDRAATRLDGRFVSQPQVEAALRETVGRAYLVLQDNSKSELHLQRSLQLRQQCLGAEHQDTLRSMALLAYAKHDAALMTQALEVRRRVLGENHPDTLASMSELALELRDAGDSARSAGLLRDVLKARRETYGEDHPETAWSMHVLANTDVAWGTSQADDREREAMFRKALAILRKVNGDVWRTYDVTLRLGQFLRSRERYEEDESLITNAIARLQSLPGAPPEMVDRLAEELIALYRDWGDPERQAAWEQRRTADAEAALARSARMLRERLESPDLLVSHAALLTRLDHLGEAEAACLMAIEIDPKNRDAANQLRALGDAHSRNGDWGQAERLYQRTLAIYRDQFGSDSWQVADTLHVAGISFREQGDLASAEAMHREALAICRSRFGDNHSQTFDLIHDLAFVLMRLPGREEEAERLFREAYKLRRQVLGDGDAHTVDTAFRLAQVLGQQKKFEEAASLLNESYAALLTNQDSKPAREFKPVLLGWIIDTCNDWGKPEMAAEWEAQLSPEKPKE